MTSPLRDSPPRERSPLDTPSVLIIDDDEATRSVLAQLVEDEGWRPLEAADGSQALAEASGRQPSVVLLDVRLPGPPAVRVAQELRELYGPTLPIIAMSASDERECAARMGAWAFLDKPFEVDEFLDLARHVFKLVDWSKQAREQSRTLRDWSSSTTNREAVRRAATQRAEALRSERLLALAKTATDAALSEYDAAAGSLVLVRSPRELETVYSSGFPRRVLDLWTTFPADVDAPIADAACGEAVWLGSLQESRERYPNLLGALCTTPWAASLCAVPLRTAGTPIGGLSLLFDRPMDFDDSLQARILSTATQTAASLSPFT